VSVLWAKRGWMSGGTFVPHQLFSSGAQGAWYDPSDFSTLYQTSTGTTPVTAVEQPVGLMLDRSRGLVLGSELWGTPALSGSSWAWDGSTLTGLGVTTGTATGSAVVAGRSYRITLTVSATGSGLFQVRVGTTFIATLTGGANTTYTYIVAAASTTGLEFTSSGGTTGTITNISCRELPGNHALQATSASRPVLRARYNLLTRSEEFDVSPWGPDNSGAGSTNPVVTANYGTAPNGTTTADRIQFTRGATGFSRIQQSVIVPAATYTYSVWLRNTSGSGASVSLRLDATDGAMITLTEAWQRVSLTASYAGGTLASQILIWSSISGSPLTADILAWGAQLLTAADEAATGGAYQRIAAATDYDVSNPVWRPYLAFDGTDDFMSLASAISITTDMTVLRGFGRSAAGIRSAGLGPASGTEPRDYFWQTTNIESYGLGATAQTLTADTATGYFVGTLRRSATDEFLRRNGTQISTRAAPAVSGSFTKLGDLSGNLNNGPIYGLIVLDRELTGSELTATEQWMAGKTGVTI
jgi:hypothetical protein